MWGRIMFAGLLAGCGLAAGLEDVVAPGAKPEKVVDGCRFAEGATVDAAGEIFFTDQPNNRILRWSREQGMRTFLSPAGRANGMCFRGDGMLLACADEKMELWAIAPDGRTNVLAAAHDGRAFNGPNDVWARPEGGCYFTDPFYKRPWWTHAVAPQDSHQVYFLAETGLPRRVTHDLTMPNGLVGSADGGRLFVADLGAGRTWVYRIEADGALTGKRLFCERGSDGMTLDTDGRLYLTGRGGVEVFGPDGVSLGLIPIPEKLTTNVCIGGPGKDLLCVTGTTGLYVLPLKVKGTAQGK